MLNYLHLQQSGLSVAEAAEVAQHAIKQKGHIIIRGFPAEVSEIERTRARFLDFSSRIGTPISHDSKNSVIWDIKKHASESSVIKTYSEHTHEAELHTDSQYSAHPEDMFNLLCMVKADCGGGESYLLSLEKVLNALQDLPNGAEFIEVLSTTEFPFIVPNVFKRRDDEKFEFNFGPILRDNEIRFRIDTFEKAVAHDPSLCTSDQYAAYRALKKIALDKSLITAFHLEPGDLIGVNNKTMLHGRSQFIDQKRHLLRIRMNHF